MTPVDRRITSQDAQLTIWRETAVHFAHGRGLAGRFRTAEEGPTQATGSWMAAHCEIEPDEDLIERRGLLRSAIEEMIESTQFAAAGVAPASGACSTCKRKGIRLRGRLRPAGRRFGSCP